MQDSHKVYLALLKQEIGNTLVPAANTDNARQIGTTSLRLIGRMLVEEKTIPQARMVAIDAYKALLPQLQAKLSPPLFAALLQTVSSLTIETFAEIEVLLPQVIDALMQNGDVSAHTLAAQLVRIDFEIRDAAEKAYLAESALPEIVASSDNEGLNSEQRERVVAFIRDKFPAENKITIAGVKVVPGGFSKQTLFISFTHNVVLPDTVVMRRDTAYNAGGTSVSQEYPLISKLHAAGVTVPQPFALEDTGKVLGSNFILVSKVAGSNIGDFLDIADPGKATAIDLARKMAKLHSVPVEDFIDCVPGVTQTTRDRVQALIEIDHKIWQSLPFPSFVMESAFNWLLRNMALADGHRALLHRDIGAHNMLVHENAVSAFLDWEIAGAGNPIEDVGYVRYMVEQMADWQDFIAAYEAAIGFKVDQRQLDFYTLWGAVRLAVLISKAKYAVVSGQAPNIQLAYVGEHFVQRLLYRVSGKLAEILAAE